MFGEFYTHFFFLPHQFINTLLAYLCCLNSKNIVHGSDKQTHSKKVTLFILIINYSYFYPIQL